MAVDLRLLGPPRLVRPDTSNRPVAAKAIALLAYLALERGPQSREHLASLLWGESPDHAARTSLRQALKQLRQLVGDDVIVSRLTVELGEPFDCDVRAFLEAARQDPRAAVEFDVPRFFYGFSVSGAPAFEEWATSTRRTLLQQYQQALRGLVMDALAQSRWHDALELTRRWLAADALSEEATRLTMEALYLAGERAAALDHYREFRERLARELGAQPGVRLSELAKRIEHGVQTIAASGPSSEELANAPALNVPLVGREPHWQMLMETWNAASRGEGRVIVLEGESGIGRTRLAEEFLHWALVKGATVLQGRGYHPASLIPYGPLAEALQGLLEAPGLAGTPSEYLAEASRLLPELRRRFPAIGEPPATADSGTSWRLVESIVQMILAAAAERPTVLFIDDLQWCDNDTCAALQVLSRRVHSAPVILMAAVTSGDLERDIPAAHLSRVLRLQAGTRVASLEPLTRDEVWEMLRTMGRIQTPNEGQRFATWLHERTDGVPLFAIELLKVLFAKGLLVTNPVSGEWKVPGPAAEAQLDLVPVSRSLYDSLGRKIMILPESLRDLLATIAVASTGVGIAVLARVHGIARIQAAALVESLVKRRLVTEDEGLYRCTHRVLADMVRESLSAVHRQELHRALALSLEQAGNGAPQSAEMLGRIARHAARGGLNGLAYQSAIRASELAVAEGKFEEALGWLELALQSAESGADREAAAGRQRDIHAMVGREAKPRLVGGRTSAGHMRIEDLDLGVLERRSGGSDPGFDGEERRRQPQPT